MKTQKIIATIILMLATSSHSYCDSLFYYGFNEKNNISLIPNKVALHQNSNYKNAIDSLLLAHNLNAYWINATLCGKNSVTAGKQVTEGMVGDVIISNGADVTFESYGQITLMPGFIVQSGGRFTARILHDNQLLQMREKRNQNTDREYLSILENDAWLVASLGYEGERFVSLLSNTHKDTLINGKQYIRIEVSFGIFDNDAIHFYEGSHLYNYIYEDRKSGKVYGYNISDNSNNLLFDFGLQVGETFPNAGVVEKVQTININGIDRKQLTFNNSGTLHTWIEGIGGTCLGLSPNAADANWFHLTCVSQGENYIYEYPFKGITCNTSTDIPQNTITSVFFISPNPVTHVLNIHVNEKLSQVNIYNLNGQCVMQTAQTDIDVSALPQGMYILRAETTGGNAHQTKFIKQ